MPVDSKIRSGRRYDIPTAITFLLAGLGVGSLLALVLSPRSQSEAEPSTLHGTTSTYRSSAL
jgi:hypothetical protein